MIKNRTHAIRWKIRIYYRCVSTPFSCWAKKQESGLFCAWVCGKVEERPHIDYAQYLWCHPFSSCFLYLWCRLTWRTDNFGSPPEEWIRQKDRWKLEIYCLQVTVGDWKGFLTSSFKDFKISTFGFLYWKAINSVNLFFALKDLRSANVQLTMAGRALSVGLNRRWTVKQIKLNHSKGVSQKFMTRFRTRMKKASNKTENATDKPKRESVIRI